MKEIILFTTIFFFSVALGSAQTPTPYYNVLAPLPQPVTNNAVTAAMANDTPCVYSFMGMDSTKIWSGIHLKAWRLNTITNQWQTLPPVPGTTGGRIAGGASTVKNRIYVLGGYHVAQNGAENSSNKLHRFDPETNTWLADGANIPVPIDDHVQAVWRDSLIFVVTGWSNTTNVANVQIYNPTTDTWTVGAAVPNNNSYKAFGASGMIKGDSIFYCGGASTGANFPITSQFRKGYINPNNPSDITWSIQSNPLAKGYRMATSQIAGGLVWLGGSNVTYNYDGIAYNGTGGVAAQARARVYYANDGLFELNQAGLFPPIMDLRGVGQVNPDYFITVGGMAPNQKVSDQVYGFQWAIAPHTQEENLRKLNIRIVPNPAADYFIIESPEDAIFQLVDLQGKLIKSVGGQGNIRIETNHVPTGTYFIKVWKGYKFLGSTQVMISH